MLVHSKDWIRGSNSICHWSNYYDYDHLCGYVHPAMMSTSCQEGLLPLGFCLSANENPDCKPYHTLPMVGAGEMELVPDMVLLAS